MVQAKGGAKDTKRVVSFSSSSGRGCEHCDDSLGIDRHPLEGIERLTRSVNHYIEHHGYHLLHVGQETSRDDEGKPWQSTVAVLGSDKPPAIREPPKVEIRFPSGSKPSLA
jgi:hypothetical protein